jgi:SAM-dependent methyltransferase
MKKWYRSWFNSPYYHILYAHRDFKEAEHFIDRICEYLGTKANERVLDAACGRGRHSVYLNKKGLDVSGVDLAKHSIEYAKKFENEHLHFFEHDIRNALNSNYFDYIFNLFTSFGYFKRDNEHLKAIRAFGNSLKPKGRIIIDFLNVEQIKSCLPFKETKVMDGISFDISKHIENGNIIKTIHFNDEGKSFEFKEEVKALGLPDFERYCASAGLSITATFGNYSLEPFVASSSDRLIIIAEKR